MVQTHTAFENETASDLLVAVRNRGDSTAFAVIFAGILALGVVAFIAIANLVFTGNASAQAPAGDFTDACRAYQTDYDNAIAGLVDPTTPAAEKGALLSHLNQVSDIWDLQCADDFGNIAVGAEVSSASTAAIFEALDFGQRDAGSNALASSSASTSTTN